jgi:PIN domain nuclease of toxin-antitoxin system
MEWILRGEKLKLMARNSSELLLDTHILLWLSAGDKRLSANAVAAIERASRRKELLLSTITLWEIGYLISKGRLQLKLELKRFWDNALSQLNATELQIAGGDAIQYHRLPAEFHGDPGDRFLVAQAMVRETSMLTADEKIIAIRDKLKPCQVIIPSEF